MSDKVAHLDTGFLIRLLNEEDAQHAQARSCFDYLLDKGIVIRVSTIVVAEYCVRGAFEDLPIANILLSPFNPTHAVKAGLFGNILHEEKTTWVQEIGDRTLLKNDAKIMAHAEVDNADWYITFDKKSKRLYDVLRKRGQVGFQFIDANHDLSAYTGEIQFKD